jgi:citrate lyase subunit beta/citryl-CoA lyase/(S)-citramalyl-CoA lyase
VNNLNRRSIICTPATATARYAQAYHCGADVGLVDLEDSVPPQHKQQGRIAAERYFIPVHDTIGELALRINSPNSLDGLRDLNALADYSHHPDIVLIPKVEAAHDIDLVAAVLGSGSSAPQLWALIETPRGVSDIGEITRSPYLGGIAFGAADYARAAGCTLAWSPLLYARSAIVNAAARFGVPAIDSPYFEIGNSGGLRREAQLARALGFCGKVAVHPRQVPVINTVFSPSAQEITRARAIVAAAGRTGDGIAVVDGHMVGTPFFGAAQALLDAYGNHR